MNSKARWAACVLTTAVAAGTMAATPPAQSQTLEPSRVVVTATDSTPASGQTFRLFGAVRSEGERVPAVVRVQTYRNGEWVKVPGAVMHTNRYNRYRIRIVLQMKGERLLRVIGNPDADGIATSRKTIRVTVH